MRKLIFAITVTLDGYCDHTQFKPNKETLDYFTTLTRAADTFLYGRKTYELMVPYWPNVAQDSSQEDNMDFEFAQAFTAVDKMIVFSRSLNNHKGNKAKILKTSLYEEVLKLKEQQGQNILTGGVAIPTQLAEFGLIDEYHLVVNPIIAGAGRRLFEAIDLKEQLQLKLIESHAFQSGIVALRYVKE